MKKTFRSALLLVACAAFAAASYAVDCVTTCAVSAYHSVGDFFLNVVATVAGPVERLLAPTVRLVQAKAFVMRLAKRERPVVTNAWRMCPST